MRNIFNVQECDLLEVSYMISEYWRLLDFDYIETELYSLSRIKIDLCDIKRIEILEEEYIQFNLFCGNISIKIEDIETIKIE